MFAIAAMTGKDWAAGHWNGSGSPETRKVC
jgi:hypothetical protein